MEVVSIGSVFFAEIRARFKKESSAKDVCGGWKSLQKVAPCEDSDYETRHLASNTSE